MKRTPCRVCGENMHSLDNDNGKHFSCKDDDKAMNQIKSDRSKCVNWCEERL